MTVSSLRIWERECNPHTYVYCGHWSRDAEPEGMISFPSCNYYSLLGRKKETGINSNLKAQPSVTDTTMLRQKRWTGKENNVSALPQKEIKKIMIPLMIILMIEYKEEEEKKKWRIR